MNANRYTQKTLDAIRTAQQMAQENQNQYVMPEHLLYALVDQDGGLIGSLLRKMGVDQDGLLAQLDTMIGNLPKVTGSNTQVYAAPETSQALDFSEKIAEKMGDSYVSVEHLMLALLDKGPASLRKMLSSGSDPGSFHPGAGQSEKRPGQLRQPGGHL